MAEPPADPGILCYDGSEDAKHAIEHAGSLFGGLRALVLTVRQPTAGLGSFAWAAAAHEGVRLAREARLEAEPDAVKAPGPVWKAIVEIADRHHAAIIVMGSRGLTGLRSMLPGSVSSAVVHHAHQPTLVVHRPSDDKPDAG